MRKDSQYTPIIILAFFFLACFMALLIGGCGDTNVTSPTQPCCDDGCTSQTHTDPCHPDCNIQPTPTPDPDPELTWVCHYGNSKKVKNVQKHLNHGDTLGKCKIPPPPPPPGDDDDDDDDGKVCICHIPPGNPDNRHVICIGEPAVQAHFTNHGDYYAPCK